MVKSYLSQERNGTGGLLFLGCSAVLAMTMIVTILLITASTARSVAESVEHTIALQCLTSCYTNGAYFDEENFWTSNKEFPAIAKDGNTIDPLKQFNDTMQTYHLMRNTERSGVASGTANEWIAMKYKKHDPESLSDKGVKNASFEIQIGGWTCFDGWWDRAIKITPNPVKVVVENGYETTIK